MTNKRTILSKKFLFTLALPSLTFHSFAVHITNKEAKHLVRMGAKFIFEFHLSTFGTIFFLKNIAYFNKIRAQLQNKTCTTYITKLDTEASPLAYKQPNY